MSKIRSVLLCDDDGAAAFGKAAPFIVEALELIKSVRTNATVVSLGHYLINTAACVSPTSSSSSRRVGYPLDSLAEELNLQRLQFQDYLAAIVASFAKLSDGGKAPVWRPSVERGCGCTSHVSVMLAARHSAHDLLVPHGVELSVMLRAQPFANYELFRNIFKRLGEIVNDGRLFTACEPRLRVLQSRFALYRAYNGAREDKEVLSAVGGGFIEGTPKKDIRPVETCMCADTLLEFIAHMHRTEPDFPLGHHSGCAHTSTSSTGTNGNTHRAQASRTEQEGDGRDANLPSKSRETLAEAMRRFLGSDAVPSHTYYSGNYTSRPCVLSAESLALRPNYTADAEQKLDLDELHDYDQRKNNYTNHMGYAHGRSSCDSHPACSNTGDGDGCKGTPHHHEEDSTNRRSARASELLHHFLTIHNGNEGELLGRLVVPMIAQQINTASSPDCPNRLELELTVSGERAGELERWARWCARCDLLGQCPRVQLCICVTQQAYRHAGQRGSTCAKSATLRGGAHTSRCASAIRRGSCRDRCVDASGPDGTGRDSGRRMYSEHNNNNNSNNGAEMGSINDDTTSHAVSSGTADVAHDLNDLMHHIFAPIWSAVLHPAAHPALARMLRHVTTFAVRFTHSAEMQELPSALDHTHCDCMRYPLTGTAPPPDALFAFHVWRNVQLLNGMACAQEYVYATAQNSTCDNPSRLGGKAEATAKYTVCRADPFFTNDTVQHGSPCIDPATNSDTSCGSHGIRDGDGGTRSRDGKENISLDEARASACGTPVFHATGALRFRVHGGNSRGGGLFLEGLIGLLLSDEIVNPSYVFQWSPLHYMYYLTQRHIVLTPSRNCVSSMNLRHVLQGALTSAIQTGLHVSVASHDTLFYHSSNDALRAELHTAMKGHRLSASDVTELCLHSMEAGTVLTQKERRGLFGYLWPRALSNYNIATASHVSSHRLQHREIALQHEMSLVCRHGLDEAHAMTSSTTTTSHASREMAQDALDHNTRRETGPDAVRAERAQRLCRFFHIPTTTVSDVTLYDRCYYEKSMRFARIRIAGPRMRAPSEFAKDIALAMVRRQRYQQCNVYHCPAIPETCDTSDDAASSTATWMDSTAKTSNASTHCTNGDSDNTNSRSDHEVSSLPSTSRLTKSGGPSDAALGSTAPTTSAKTHYKTAANVVSALTAPSYSSPANAVSPATAAAPAEHAPYLSRVRESSAPAYHCLNGVFHLVSTAHEEERSARVRADQVGKHVLEHATCLPTWLEYQEDVRHLRGLTHHRELQRFTTRRLGMLECKYNLHAALTNEDEDDYAVCVGTPSEPTVSSPSLPVPEDAHASSVAHDIAQTSAADPSYSADTHSSSPACRSMCAVQRVRGDGSSDAVATALPTSHIYNHECYYRRRRGFRRSDLYSCIKVDVHCHIAGGMTARALLSFMKNKLERCGDDVVELDAVTHKPVTLRDKFEQLLLQQLQREATTTGDSAQCGTSCTPGTSQAVMPTPSHVPPLDANSTCKYLYKDMTTGTLQVRAGRHTFNRFDEFNSRYSPMGVPALRSIFLKTDNFMGGQYFAELIRGTFEQQAREGYTYSEYRLSIYGRHPQEWDRLARWFVIHGMSHRTNRWIIQIPRLFALYRRSGMLHNFQDMLTNLFAPLWEASTNPERHPFLNYFLHHISGFDSVDNENDRESDEAIYLTPSEWTRAKNPPYAYYVYYMWANIVTLNRYRAARGLCTFSFRPHGGESGDPDHMADIFLLADGVGHGINLARRPVLQYLYYLSQIPLAVVPLSNNALFCKYADNPLPVFLRRGLNVALGTDSSLMFHHTEQPLIEEYSTAQIFWNLSDTDMYELARNSVLMSGFSTARKQEWLGSLFRLSSVAGNDVNLSNVPMTRCAFRYEVYFEEINYLQARSTVHIVNRAMQSAEEEDLHILDTLGITRQEVLRHRWWGTPLPCVGKSVAPATLSSRTVPRTVRVAVSNL